MFSFFVTKPKWIIYKRESDKNHKCLSVSNFGILSLVIVCSTSTVYTSLSRDSKYLLKNTVFYLRLSKHGKILGFQDFLLEQNRNTDPLCLKNYKRYFSSPNFHRLCVLLMHIFWYVNVPNVPTSYEKLWYNCEFLYFTTCLKRYIKLLQIVCWGRSIAMKCKPM